MIDQLQSEPVAKKARLNNGDDNGQIIESDVLPGLEEDGFVDDEALLTSKDSPGVLVCLKEEDVGISSFMSDHFGFRATLKARWEDFLVHEVAEDNSLVQLTNYELPKGSQKAAVDETQFSLTDKVKSDLEKVFSKEIPSIFIEAPANKEERTQLHRSIKYFYPTLCSETKVDKDNQRKILIRPNSDLSHREKQRGNNQQRGGKFCHFVLYKEGKETSAVLSLLSRLLNLTSNQVAVCGNKDKRAITSQKACIKNMDAGRLKNLNDNLDGIRLGNFSYEHDTLRLGDLSGNRFTLVMREVEGSDSEIQNAISTLQTDGFINYFGMQRFGISEVSSYQVGLEILKSNWPAAIDLVLKPTKTDLPLIREWKEKYASGTDIDECIKGIPHSIEKSLLLGIKQHNGKNENAFSKLSRNLRQLYLHSFQSLIWNKVATRRIKELGKQPVSGDLVFLGDSNAHRKSKSGTAPRVKVLSESDIRDYSLKDIVLTIPGADVTYPHNQVKTWYTEILKDYGLDEKCFKQKNKDYILNGSYRHLVVMAKDVSAKIQYYTDPLIPLVLSDKQLIEGKRLNDQKSGSPNSEMFKAVILEMTLPKSAYATMAVREASKNVNVTK